MYSILYTYVCYLSFVEPHSLVNELVHRVQNLELSERQRELGARQTLSTTSYAEYYKSRKVANLSVCNQDVGRAFQKNLNSLEYELHFGVLPTGLESTIVQPYWSGKIQEWNVMLRENHAQVRFLDSHARKILGKNSPDVILLTSDGSVSPFNIVVVGELKGKDEIDDGARGHLEKYLQLVLQEQPFRTSVYGFLTDNISLHLVIATRTKDAIHTDWILDVSWNTTDSGVQAAKVVSCLASMSLTELHYHLPSLVVVEQGKVELQGVLGNGLSGFVYKGKLGERTLVVKVFKDLERLSHEERMLSKLRRFKVLHIPSINAVTGNALLLTPLARSFVSVGETGPFLAPLHIQQMVETLHQAHCCDIVHRDVRSANIYAVTKHEVLLNDWGSSCSVGECISYEGVIAEASDHILALLIDGKHVLVVRPNDDLHALARTVYRILFKPPPHMIASTMKVEGLKKIKQFWNDCGRSWQEIFELAEHAVVQDRNTYKLFEDALCGILHVVDVHTWAEW